MGTLSNIKVSDFRNFLKMQGLHYICTKGGHEKWNKEELLRPVIFQTHIDPIPISVLKNNLRTIGCTTKDLIDFLNK